VEAVAIRTNSKLAIEYEMRSLTCSARENAVNIPKGIEVKLKPAYEKTT
jgi:hypothetical protein